MGALTDYLATLAAADAAALARVVEIARRVAPEAREGTSYGVAALRLEGRPLIGLRAGAASLSLYPFSPDVVTAVAPQLDRRSVSKGTIRFTAEAPLSEALVEQVVRLRAAEIRGAPEGAG